MKNEGDDFGWGVVVNFSKKSNVKVNHFLEGKMIYNFLVTFFQIHEIGQNRDSITLREAVLNFDIGIKVLNYLKFCP